MKFVKIKQPHGDERWLNVEKVVMVRAVYDNSQEAPPHTIIGSAIVDVTSYPTFSLLKPDELMARLLAAKEGETV